MNTTFPTLICNTGLGDFYVLLGAMVYLARKYGGLRVPALPQYKHIQELCLIDHPEIEVFKIIDDEHMVRDYKKMGGHTLWCHWTQIAECERRTHQGISWDHWQYETLEVPFEERWSSNPLEAAAQHFIQIVFPGPYYLIHEDAERGFPILFPPWHPAITTRRIAPYGTLSPLSWVGAIKRAKELHFIDSSMWHMAESITMPKEQPKYIHRYIRPWHPTWHAIETRYHWRYIA
jgi:hypothetical protein